MRPRTCASPSLLASAATVGTHLGLAELIAGLQVVPVRGVVEAAVWSMVGLGATASSMTAAIGPCIGPDSYEVGLEFLETFASADPENARFFGEGVRPEKRLFDLPAFVLSRLARAGVADAEWIGCDTLADERFFSNRRAVHRGEADYGRLLSAIMLEA